MHQAMHAQLIETVKQFRCIPVDLVERCDFVVVPRYWERAVFTMESTLLFFKQPTRWRPNDVVHTVTVSSTHETTCWGFPIRIGYSPDINKVVIFA
jgi:hypothetical protein